MLGSAFVTPETIDLKLPINVINEDLLDNSICLTGESSKITGRYDLTGSFSAHEQLNEFLETPGELINAIEGEISLKARDGAVEESPFFSRLLSVINLTEIYSADYLSQDKNKLGYQTLQVEANLAQRRIKVPKFHFNGTTLEIVGNGHIDIQPSDFNIELLVAPLKTVDTVVKWIPGINYLLAGNLITIPVRVSGPIDNINSNVSPASSVGQGVLGIAERILKIPVKLVEPLTGDDSDQEPEVP